MSLFYITEKERQVMSLFYITEKERQAGLVAIDECARHGYKKHSFSSFVTIPDDKIEACMDKLREVGQFVFGDDIVLDTLYLVLRNGDVGKARVMWKAGVCPDRMRDLGAIWRKFLAGK